MKETDDSYEYFNLKSEVFINIEQFIKMSSMESMLWVISLLSLYLQESVGDLMIRNIQLHHSGKYVCMVQTTLDSQSATAEIIVRGMSVKYRHIYLLEKLEILNISCFLNGS